MRPVRLWLSRGQQPRRLGGGRPAPGPVIPSRPQPPLHAPFFFLGLLLSGLLRGAVLGCGVGVLPRAGARLAIAFGRAALAGCVARPASPLYRVPKRAALFGARGRGAAAGWVRQGRPRGPETSSGCHEFAAPVRGWARGRGGRGRWAGLARIWTTSDASKRARCGGRCGAGAAPTRR
jgi:hypothetical protein